MAWDPKGERLAVLFERDSSQAYLYVALFSVKRNPLLDLTPIGLVKGPLTRDSEVTSPVYPVYISFAHHYERGALLAIVSNRLMNNALNMETSSIPTLLLLSLEFF